MGSPKTLQGAAGSISVRRIALTSAIAFSLVVVIEEAEAAMARPTKAGKNMNGQANNGPETGSGRVFRYHDRPTISVPELVAIQRGYLERLGSIVEQLSGLLRVADVLTNVTESPSRDVIADASAGRWTVLTTKPFTGVAVHADAGRLIFDLRSIEGNVRVQLTPRELPVLLKTFIEAAAQLAAAAN